MCWGKGAVDVGEDASVSGAKELAQAGEYGGFAVKVLDEQGNEVTYVPIGKRSN